MGLVAQRPGLGVPSVRGVLLVAAYTHLSYCTHAAFTSLTRTVHMLMHMHMHMPSYIEWPEGEDTRNATLESNLRAVNALCYGILRRLFRGRSLF